MLSAIPGTCLLAESMCSKHSPCQELMLLEVLGVDKVALPFSAIINALLFVFVMLLTELQGFLLFIIHFPPPPRKALHTHTHTHKEKKKKGQEKNPFPPFPFSSPPPWQKKKKSPHLSFSETSVPCYMLLCNYRSKSIAAECHLLRQQNSTKSVSNASSLIERLFYASKQFIVFLHA